MPRVEASVVSALKLRADPAKQGFALHDVWRVDLDGHSDRTLDELRDLGAAAPRNSVGLPVRALFSLRSALGRLLHLDRRDAADGRRLPEASVVPAVPPALAAASRVPPGTPEGPFRTLYRLPDEGAFEALNATVHAILVVTLESTGSGSRLHWVTYLRPVGRITGLYMGLIDPFRRLIVYPGLERWLKRVWSDSPSGAGQTA